MQPELRDPRASLREQTAPAVGEAPIAAPIWRDWATSLAVGTAAGVFLAFVGAFDTVDTPFAGRLLYWIPVMLAGTVLGRVIAFFVARMAHVANREWLTGALITVGVALPGSLAIWAYTSFYFHQPLRTATLPFFLFAGLVVSAAMTAIMMLVARPGRLTHAFAPPGAPTAQVRFMERLPPKLKGAVIYAISAEDHYLRLHTSKGSDLILMRLSDALSELEGLEGAQTHRSWWVGRNAVESVERNGDKIVLVLRGGAKAPVSRPNVRALREAGWF